LHIANSCETDNLLPEGLLPK